MPDEAVAQFISSLVGGALGGAVAGKVASGATLKVNNIDIPISQLKAVLDTININTKNIDIPISQLKQLLDLIRALEPRNFVELITPKDVADAGLGTYDWVYITHSPFYVKEENTAYIPFHGAVVGSKQDYYLAPINKYLEVDLKSAVKLTSKAWGTAYDGYILDLSTDELIAYGHSGGYLFYDRYAWSTKTLKSSNKTTIGAVYSAFAPGSTLELVGIITTDSKTYSYVLGTNYRSEPISFSVGRIAITRPKLLEVPSVYLECDRILTLFEHIDANSPENVIASVGAIDRTTLLSYWHLPLYSMSWRYETAPSQPRLAQLFGRTYLFGSSFTYAHTQTPYGKHRVVAVEIPREWLLPEHQPVLISRAEGLASGSEAIVRNWNGARLAVIEVNAPGATSITVIGWGSERWATETLGSATSSPAIFRIANPPYHIAISANASFNVSVVLMK